MPMFLIFILNAFNYEILLKTTLFGGNFMGKPESDVIFDLHDIDNLTKQMLMIEKWFK